MESPAAAETDGGNAVTDSKSETARTETLRERREEIVRKWDAMRSEAVLA